MLDLAHLRPVCATLMTLSLALAVGYGACVEDKQLDVETWQVRDMLGLGPDWFDNLSPAQVTGLEKKLSQEIQRQSREATSVELTHDELDPEPAKVVPPRRAISLLDQRLEAMQRSPVLIQWSVYLDEEHTTPVATACPLTSDDFGPQWPQGAGRQTSRWTLDEAFSKPLRGQADGLSEDAALRARLPMLERWISRCAEDLDPAVNTLGPDDRLEVRRAQGAPALVSWWPQGKRIYLNPSLLLLWTPQSPTFRTAGQPQEITNNPYDACIIDTLNYCAACDTPAEAAANSCEDPLLPNGDALSTCQAIAGMDNGIQRFCVNAMVSEFGDALRQCIATRLGDEACDLTEAVNDSESLMASFEIFVGTPTCVTALRLCLERDEGPAPQPDFVPPEPSMEPEPEAFPEDDDSECAGACAEIGCELLCAGLEVCSESDAGGGGGGASGCEGDTLDGADPSCCEGSP